MTLVTDLCPAHCERCTEPNWACFQGSKHCLAVFMNKQFHDSSFACSTSVLLKNFRLTDLMPINFRSENSLHVLRCTETHFWQPRPKIAGQHIHYCKRRRLKHERQCRLLERNGTNHFTLCISDLMKKSRETTAQALNCLHKFIQRSTYRSEIKSRSFTLFIPLVKAFSYIRSTQVFTCILYSGLNLPDGIKVLIAAIKKMRNDIVLSGLLHSPGDFMRECSNRLPKRSTLLWNIVEFSIQKSRHELVSIMMGVEPVMRGLCQGNSQAATLGQTTQICLPSNRSTFNQSRVFCTGYPQLTIGRFFFYEIDLSRRGQIANDQLDILVIRALMSPTNVFYEWTNRIPSLVCFQITFIKI